MATSELELKNQGPIDVVRHRGIYLGITLVLLIPGIYFIIMNMLNPAIKAPVLLGIDFRGGTLLEYGFEQQLTQDDLDIIRAEFDKQGHEGAVIQLQERAANAPTQEGTSQVKEAPAAGTAPAAPAGQTTAPTQPSPQAATTSAPAQAPAPAGNPNAPVEKVATPQPSATQAPAPTAAPATPEAAPAAALETAATEAAPSEVTPENIRSVVSIRSEQLNDTAASAIQTALEQRFGNIVLLQKNSIGPSLAKELLTNGLLALLLAYLLIVGYLTFRFQFDYAVCAIIALVHDSIFVLGFFAMMGALFHTEVDSLFITAMLTVVGFSVHDTIVVFDRIRENTKRYFTRKVPFTLITNMSVNQTLARSINTSVTALLPLVALYLFGGETTQNFVLAIIVGIAMGTFSSICVASMMLSWWREKQEPVAATA